MISWKRRTAPHEEVEYEPLTVLEILTEMKDLSELMTSLAYSALILDNDPLGDEVEELARRMDWLKYQLRLTASLGVRTTEEAEQVAGIMQVADASEHISNAAAGMMELVESDVDLRPVLGGLFDEADDRITTLTVPDDSRAAGQTLGDLRLETMTGQRCLAIRRGRRWHADPGADARLEAGDHLIVRGQDDGAEHLKKWLAGEVEDL